MATRRRNPVVVNHLPLSGSYLPLQLCLAQSFQNDKGRYTPRQGYHTPHPEDVASTGSVDVVELMYVGMSHSAGIHEETSAHLLVVSIGRYLRAVPHDERRRLVAILFPCLFLAASRGWRLRLVLVGFGDRPADLAFQPSGDGDNQCWIIMELVDPSAAAAGTPTHRGRKKRTPAPLPRALGLPGADVEWSGAFFDVSFTAAAAGRPFHAVAARFEVLLVLYTVLVLSGAPVGAFAYRATVASDPDATALRVAVTVPGVPPTSGSERPALLVLEDAALGITLTHRAGHHTDFASLFPLHGLAVTLWCPSCGSGQGAVQPRSRACGRCDLSAEDCWGAAHDGDARRVVTIRTLPA